MVIPQNTLSGPIGTSGTAPSQSLPPPANQNQSVEQQALNGGGVNNRQQVSNFMNALNRTGQGTNNGFMNAPPPQSQPYQPIVQNGMQMATAQSTPNQLMNQNTISGPAFLSQAPSNMAGTNTPGYYNAGSITPGTDAGAVHNSNDVLPPGVSNSYNPGSIPQLALPGSSTYYNHGVAPQLLPPTSSSPTTTNPGTSASYTPAPSPQLVPPYNSTTLSSNPFASVYVSDENLKENVTPGDDKVNQFLNTIHAHNYEYKDKQDGVGQFTSPMAQELEKTELGKQAVIDTPRGKMVDYGRLGGVNLAAVSVVHRENQKLQKQVDELRRMFKGNK